MPAPKDPVKYIEWKQKLSKYSAFYDEWLSMYTLKQMSIYQISEIYKCSPVTVYNYIKKCNALRPIGESISISLRGKPKSETHKRNLSEARKGWQPTKEHKAKMLEAAKRPRSPEVRARMREWMKGHYVSEETKQKLSIRLKGRKISEETRRKMSNSHKGKKLSFETIEKLRQAIKGRPSPLRGTKRSPDICKRISKGRADSWAKVPKEERLKRMLKLRAICGKKRPTSIEKAVMGVLEQMGETFKFQYPFGRFVVDFYLPKRNVVIEADGTYWHSIPERQKQDKAKDKYLASLGIKVIRITDKEINKNAYQAVTESLAVLKGGNGECLCMHQKMG